MIFLTESDVSLISMKRVPVIGPYSLAKHFVWITYHRDVKPGIFSYYSTTRDNGRTFSTWVTGYFQRLCRQDVERFVSVNQIQRNLMLVKRK